MTYDELANYCKEASKIISELDYKNRMLEKENQELKKKLEDANEKILLLQASEPMLNYKKALEKTQQKKFIKYLEDENKKLDVKANGMGASSERDELITNARAYRKILQKYKSIIGVLDENNKQ